MIKPFKLDNIKKITRHEVDLIHALYEFLPATDIRDKLHVAIRKTLMKHLGQDLRYYLSSVEKMEFGQFAAALPQTPLLMVLGLTPIPRKAIVQIDFNIANLAINKLLGAGDAPIDEAKPLTETEQGVLQYLIMQVLSQIHQLAGAESRVHFRFEKFAFDQKEILGLAKAKEGVYILNIEISISGRSGFVKLVFPHPFLEDILVMPHGAGNTKKEREYFGRQLEKWNFVKASLWAEAGTSLLSPIEIRDLESGDVVLFDDTSLKFSGKKIGGKVLLHFGDGPAGVEAEITEMPAKLVRCRLDNIVR